MTGAPSRASHGVSQLIPQDRGGDPVAEKPCDQRPQSTWAHCDVAWRRRPLHRLSGSTLSERSLLPFLTWPTPIEKTVWGDARLDDNIRAAGDLGRLHGRSSWRARYKSGCSRPADGRENASGAVCRLRHPASRPPRVGLDRGGGTRGSGRFRPSPRTLRMESL